ncbi:MAG: hypothetical protein KDA16_03050, partial [Phycisphaerales bacterium]|nr:hypothetical protein [Phycisphaerales bacterium]
MKRVVALIGVLAVGLLATSAAGAEAAGAPSINPVSVMEDAAKAVPGLEGDLSGALNVVILLTVL